MTPTDICRDWMGVFRRDQLPYVSANRISVSFYVQILITRSRLEALCDGNFDAVSRLELLDEAQALAAYTAPVYRLRHVALLIAFRQASAVGEAARASSYADQMAEIIDDEDVRQSDAGEILVPVVFSQSYCQKLVTVVSGGAFD